MALRGIIGNKGVLWGNGKEAWKHKFRLLRFGVEGLDLNPMLPPKLVDKGPA